MPSVLVTGAGRGIGRTTAFWLLDGGWDVYAGVRRREDGDALLAEDERIRPVLLDVTDPEHLAALPEAVGHQLDAVVNNAGIVVSGPVEALAASDLRRQLDVNVVSQVAVTQAVMGMLRESQGRIVFIGSVSGRVSSPFLGAYAASKYAIEGLADALRVELRPWRINVALVEPGAIDTDMWRGAQETVDEVEAGLTPAHRELYGKQIGGMRKLTARLAKQTAPPEKVAAAVERALTARRPRARYVVGKDARAQLVMKALTPTGISDAAIGRMSGGR